MSSKEPVALRTLTVEDLAPLLHRSVETLRRDVNRRPESLPPRLRIPGSKRLLWLEQDVAEWLRKCRDV